MEKQIDVRGTLEKHFGFREFLEGQEGAVDAILNGEDALIVMPTGGGKSLCYQLPAMLLQGITLVVSPLIALMKDQVDGMAAKKIPATFINSSLAESEIDDRMDRMMRGEFRLVYVAPERFKSNRFIEAISPLSIALFAIDEAHCISQWGHDFRPDYLRLKWALKNLGQPQVAALTATATPEVRADIIAQLSLGQGARKPPRVFVSGFARQNLTLAVTRARGRSDKMERILHAIKTMKTGIVYCSTRKNVERVADELRGHGVACISYHGGMNDKDRATQQDRFMSGGCPVAVATNAFGMGVDRADLRFVMHYDIPGSVEAYYQEAGRAGRDGEPALCEMLFNYADTRTQEFFIKGANPTKEVILELYTTLKRLCAKGPIKMPISDIASRMIRAENEMAVGAALYLLERAGCISRDYEQGGRTYTTRLVEPVKQDGELAIDFEALDKKLARDMRKLEKIIAYADGRTCRHHFILDYFGDSQAAGNCVVCDNCRASISSADIRLPTDEETVAIQKVLSCVGRMNDRYGRARIMQTLVGSKSKEVLDVGLDRLSTYGIMAAEGSDYVWGLIEALVKGGCIEVSSGKYPTLSLTPLGKDVVHRRKTIPLAMPRRTSAASKPERKSRKTASAATVRGGGSYDDRVFEALRKWRSQRSAALNGLPAYLIFSDATLYELAEKLPGTQEELLGIRGIGPAKAARFGRDALTIIGQYRKA